MRQSLEAHANRVCVMQVYGPLETSNLDNTVALAATLGTFPVTYTKPKQLTLVTGGGKVTSLVLLSSQWAASSLRTSTGVDSAVALATVDMANGMDLAMGGLLSP